MPIMDFYAYSADDLYNNVKKHNFTKYITPEQTFLVEVKVTDSGALNNNIFLAQKN